MSVRLSGAPPDFPETSTMKGVQTPNRLARMGKGRRIARVATVIAIVSAAILAAILYYQVMTGHPSPVEQSGEISSVNYTIDGASQCWSSHAGTGFPLPKGGGVVTFFDSLTYVGGAGKPASCSVISVAISTVGFDFVRSNTPLEVSSGSSAQLNITMVTPSEPPSFSTVLSVDLNVTAT